MFFYRSKVEQKRLKQHVLSKFEISLEFIHSDTGKFAVLSQVVMKHFLLYAIKAEADLTAYARKHIFRTLSFDVPRLLRWRKF